jgi:2-methylcitrate dehydratase PrpD
LNSGPPERNSIAAHYLARLVHQIAASRFSDEDRVIVRQHMLDAIAAAFIGCRSNVFHDLTKLCARIPNGCPWPGSGSARVHPFDSAMLWAFSINASVFEDGSREGACHPAAAIIPAILALSKGKSWDAIEKAVVAGYDVMVRLARGGNPEFTRRGFHPTAITAPFGAAATASSILGLDFDTAQHAICLAALGCAGLMSSFRSGDTQPLQVAWSVRSGVAAAMMARAGHPGYDRIIEEGFYPAYLGKAPHPPIEKPLEYEYAIKGSYLKPYPGCRHVHPSIDALTAVLKKYKINPSQIKKIQVRTYKIAVETEIHTLDERGDAYFNIPYALAARMVLDRNDWDAFDEKHFSNQQLMAVMKKVRVDVDPELESRYPKQRGSVVEVDVGEGEPLRGEVSCPLGEPENPISFSVTIEKFRETTASFLSKKSRDRVEKIIDVSRWNDSAETLFEVLSENKRAR